MNKTRKILATGLSVFALGALSLGFSACAEKDLAYRLSADGEYYVVAGIGEYDKADVVVKSTYNGKPVKEIRYEAFDYYENMRSITIPDSVTSIGEHAFAYCKNLESISFGNGLESIETEAFLGCGKLTSLSFGNGLTSIGEHAFGYCAKLQSVEFGNSQASIGAQAFKDCTKLSALDLDGVQTIGTSSFQGCTALTSLTLNGVETVGKSAFAECSALERVELGDSVQTLMNSAFSYCKALKEVFISKTVKVIDNTVFSGCDKLKQLYFKGTKAECGFASTASAFTIFYFSQNNPFSMENTSYTDCYWCYENGKAKHWNKNVGSACALVYAKETGAYTINVGGTEITDVRFNGQLVADVYAAGGNIHANKPFLYQKQGVNYLSWQQDGIINIYTLKVVKDGVLNFEDGKNEFVKSMDSAATIKGVTDALAGTDTQAATGNGEKSLWVSGTGGSIYIGIDADFVHAAFANNNIEALQLKIYTPYDIRQKLAWYFQTYSTGNQIISNISYTDEGDYLLVNFHRAAYESWTIRNTYSDTDVLQFLFRFTRDALPDETPSTSGTDKESSYVWVCPGDFYIDDIKGVESFIQ